uniref:Uncharacterized protein n=1 Tax=Romanomermis culicivorax TaxID=13658 RepID=A0A915JP92_ROMCU
LLCLTFTSNKVFIGNASVIKKLVEVELKRDLNITPSQLYEKIRTDHPALPGLEAVVNDRDRKQITNMLQTKITVLDGQLQIRHSKQIPANKGHNLQCKHIHSRE